jgi:hypothetical protein
MSEPSQPSTLVSHAMEGEAMRLMDALMQEPDDLLVLTAQGRRMRLPGAGAVRPALRQAALRYVLDRDVLDMATSLSLDSGGLLARSLDLIACPAEAFWVEWCEKDRRAALQALGVEGIAPGAPGDRAGVLVQADETGRRGLMRSCWQAGGQVCVSPLTFRFDFDAGPAPAETAVSLRLRAVDSEDLDAILTVGAFDLDPTWEAYWRAQRPNGSIEKLAQQALGPMFADGALVAGLNLLLAARGATRKAPVDLGQLNRARGRCGRAPLLDHIEVKAALLQAVDAGPGAASGDALRRPVRLHHVRGHLVRRGERLYWRRAHLRGDGPAPLRRTVTLQMAR